jgi:hypothetical protein
MRELGANLQQAAITATTPKNPNEKIARGHPRSRTCGSPRSSETLGVTGFYDGAHSTRQPHNHPLQAGSLHRLMFRARAPSCHSRLGKDLPRRVTTPKLLLSLAELFGFFLYSLDGFFFVLLRESRIPGKSWPWSDFCWKLGISRRKAFRGGDEQSQSFGGKECWSRPGCKTGVARFGGDALSGTMPLRQFWMRAVPSSTPGPATAECYLCERTGWLAYSC